MALFTDGTISAVDDLAAQDSGILEVASTEGIDVTKKLRLAQDELAMELSSRLSPSDSLRNVVVTTPIRLWHAFRTLEVVYRDAYSNQLNERYGRKRDQFAELARWAFCKLIEGGVGVTGNPVAKADPAELTFFSGQQAGATYYVCTSWISTLGEEGAAGEWRAVTVPDNNVLSVRAANPPENSAGWNVFVGLSPDMMTQQNESVLPPGQAWLQESTVSTGGPAPGSGQAADQVRVLPRILQRG
jgi:hypothetical protein